MATMTTGEDPVLRVTDEGLADTFETFLSDFVEDNAETLEADELATLHALEVGDRMTIGGGAGVLFTVRRIE